MERSSSTIPQTHIFFVSNIKGLAQTVLTWEGKVFAAADADAAETDWKHKSPERGDLINMDRIVHLWWRILQVNLQKHTRLPETEILSNTNQFKYQPMLS